MFWILESLTRAFSRQRSCLVNLIRGNPAIRDIALGASLQCRLCRYDTGEMRSFLKKRSAMMTNSSSVFDEPCAEHLMAWLLADARQLYPSYGNQRGSRSWPQNYLRENIRLLADETILIVGYGAIGRRLASCWRRIRFG